MQLTPHHVLYTVISSFKLWTNPRTCNIRERTNRLLRHHNQQDPIDGLTYWEASVDDGLVSSSGDDTWPSRFHYQLLYISSLHYWCLVFGSCIFCIFMVYYFTSWVFFRCLFMYFLGMSCYCFMSTTFIYTPIPRETDILNILQSWLQRKIGIENIIRRERASPPWQPEMHTPKDANVPLGPTSLQTTHGHTML